MKPEAKFSREQRAAFEREGACVVKTHGSRYSTAGLPDLHVDSLTWCGWLELKVGRAKVTPVQRSVMRRITAAGGLALVLRRVSDDTFVETHEGAVLARRNGCACLEDLAEQSFNWRVRQNA